MGPVRIRHSSHGFGWQSSHSVDLAGWQAEMASIAVGYRDVMRTSPIADTRKEVKIKLRKNDFGPDRDRTHGLRIIAPTL